MRFKISAKSLIPEEYDLKISKFHQMEQRRVVVGTSEEWREPFEREILHHPA